MNTFVFLIYVVTSNTSQQILVPMDSMAHCRAALQAMKDVKSKRSWSDLDPRIDNAYCIEEPK